MAKKQFLYENVYNDLKQKIECGDLKPGGRKSGITGKIGDSSDRGTCSRSDF